MVAGTVDLAAVLAGAPPTAADLVGVAAPVAEARMAAVAAVVLAAVEAPVPQPALAAAVVPAAEAPIARAFSEYMWTFECVKGGFLLRKKPLPCVAPDYTIPKML